MQPGKRNSITDIAGFLVGNATDQHIKTGTTVFTNSVPFTTAVHTMGGAPGTRETDLLKPDRLVQKVDALVLSGGSAFGLEAASGVTNALARVGRGYQVEDHNIPIVPAAILFDLLNGGDKKWVANPYGKLGEEAFISADIEFQIGSVGVGAGATASSLKGGLGTASLITHSGFTVGALFGVNSLGSVIQGESAHFWAAPMEINGEFGDVGISCEVGTCFDTGGANLSSQKGTNTTIGIVATDANLTQSELTRVAVAAHDGMARAIVPSHTLFDGDLIFAASNGQLEVKNREEVIYEIAHCAAICTSRAIARGVFEATPHPNDIEPTWKSKYSRND